MLIRPVVALVTAYNEQETIGPVIDVLTRCPNVDRVQIVDDGSTDRTADIVRERGADLICLSRRVPVGDAIKRHLDNIPESEGSLLWCDADLLNLEVQHIESLLLAMKTNDVSMVVGSKDNLPFLPIRASAVLPRPLLELIVRFFARLGIHVAGERVIHRSVFEKAMEVSSLASGYAIVILLNLYCQRFAEGYLSIFMPRLTHRNKYSKWGWRGALEIPGEVAEFVVGYFSIRRQLWAAKRKQELGKT